MKIRWFSVAVPLMMLLAGRAAFATDCHAGKIVDVTLGRIVIQTAAGKSEAYEATDADSSNTAVWQSLDNVKVCKTDVADLLTIENRSLEIRHPEEADLSKVAVRKVKPL